MLFWYLWISRRATVPGLRRRFFGGRSRLGAELRPVRERESSDFGGRSGLGAGLRPVCKSSDNEIGLPRTCQCAPNRGLRSESLKGWESQHTMNR